MEPDELWSELDLGALLRHPELIPNKMPMSSLKKSTHIIETGNHLDDRISAIHLTHEKEWQKPTYAVLKERYQSLPHQPSFYNPKNLGKLADPLRGKFTKLYNKQTKNVSYKQLNRPIKSWNSDTYIQQPGKSISKGFFITETDEIDGNESMNSSKVKSSLRNNVDKDISSTKKSWKDNMMSGLRKQVPSTYNYRDKTKRYTNVNSASRVVLDKVKSSGYNTVFKAKGVLQKSKQPIQSWKSNTAWDSNNNNNKINDSGHDNIFTRHKKNKIPLYTRVEEGVLAEKNKEISAYRRHDIIRDRNSSNSSHDYKRNPYSQPKPNHQIRQQSKSAPALLSSIDKSSLENRKDKSDNETKKLSRVEKLKATVIESRGDNVVSQSVPLPIESKASALLRKKLPEIPERSTQEVLETLKRLEGKESSRYDSLESKLLTSQLAKYAERIGSHLQSAINHSNSYKEVSGFRRNDDESVSSQKVTDNQVFSNDIHNDKVVNSSFESSPKSFAEDVTKQGATDNVLGQTAESNVETANSSISRSEVTTKLMPSSQKILHPVLISSNVEALENQGVTNENGSKGVEMKDARKEKQLQDSEYDEDFED